MPVFVRLREDAAGCLVLPEKAGAALERDLVLPVGGRIDGVLGLLDRGTERTEGAADFRLLAG